MILKIMKLFIIAQIQNLFINIKNKCIKIL